ncbi:hypothetical protein [Sinomonas sp. G460-2]|uniref:hypothetical protein n=1 Tax=Sinomonas sp. G460-2 TaxID=3393464 RepID=UPI0039EF7D19
MAQLDPKDPAFDCRLTLHGVPEAQTDPAFYPHERPVDDTTSVFGDDAYDEGQTVTVGSADVFVLPDVHGIDLLYTLDAHSQQLMSVAEGLVWSRPDLPEELFARPPQRHPVGRMGRSRAHVPRTPDRAQDRQRHPASSTPTATSTSASSATNPRPV